MLMETQTASANEAGLHPHPGITIRVLGSGTRVSGFEGDIGAFTVTGASANETAPAPGYHDPGSGFRVSGSGTRVSGFEECPDILDILDTHRYRGIHRDSRFRERDRGAHALRHRECRVSGSGFRGSGDTTPCKVTPINLHGVV